MNAKDLSLFLLRVGLGILFFLAGWAHLTAATPFSAAGYLKGSVGPFATFFQGFAGNEAVNLIVPWLLIVGGSALILGVLTRLASFGLGIFMASIYLSHLPPAAPNSLVEEHVILILGLLVVSTYEAGKVWGLGKWVSKFGPWAT